VIACGTASLTEFYQTILMSCSHECEEITTNMHSLQRVVVLEANTAHVDDIAMSEVANALMTITSQESL
jgi:hypothetical protein